MMLQHPADPNGHPISDSHNRSRNEPDGLQRMFLDVELAVKPHSVHFEHHELAVCYNLHILQVWSGSESLSLRHVFQSTSAW
jgi:hypothetical protein